MGGIKKISNKNKPNKYTKKKKEAVVPEFTTETPCPNANVTHTLQPSLKRVLVTYPLSAKGRHYVCSLRASPTPPLTLALIHPDGDALPFPLLYATQPP